MGRIKKFFKFFLNILSFNSPRIRVFNLTSILLILTLIPTKVIESTGIKCVFKHFILPLIFNGDCPADGIFANCNCPACGMTRAMSKLLHGDVNGAWQLNKLVFLVLIVMVVLIIINLRKVYNKRKPKK